jgi:hypothetical protein
MTSPWLGKWFSVAYMWLTRVREGDVDDMVGDSVWRRSSYELIVMPPV